MIQAETWENARGRRAPLRHQDFDGYRTDFFHGDGEGSSPQALYVELTPGWVLRTHFHLQHQFQVITAGSGRLGRRELAPFALHYASPESGYGPIVAGDDGLSYLALRAVTEQGGYFLPESRDRMRRDLRKQEISIGAPQLSDSAALKSRTAIEVSTMIAPAPNGLAAWLMRVPPNTTAEAPVHPGGGRFYVVAGGAMIVSGDRKPRLSTIWTSEDEGPLPLAADAMGLEVLVLQFPAGALSA